MTTAIAQWQGSALPVSVHRYGAIGDGTTDDTAAIQAAINANPVVSLDPNKTYSITQVNVPDGYSVISEGEGPLIKLQAAIGFHTEYGLGNQFKNLRFDFVYSGAIALDILGSSYCRVENLVGGTVGGPLTPGTLVRLRTTLNSGGVYNCSFRDLQSHYLTSAVKLLSATTVHRVNANIFDNLYAAGNTAAIDIEGGSYNLFTGGHDYEANTTAIKIRAHSSGATAILNKWRGALYLENNSTDYDIVGGTAVRGCEFYLTAGAIPPNTVVYNSASQDGIENHPVFRTNYIRIEEDNTGYIGPDYSHFRLWPSGKTYPCFQIEGPKYTDEQPHLRIGTGAAAADIDLVPLRKVDVDLGDPASISAGATYTSGDITFTGAEVGDFVHVSFNGDLSGITATAYVKATNTVKINLFNGTASPIDLPYQYFNLYLHKKAVTI